MQINVIPLPAEGLEFGHSSTQVVHLFVNALEASEIMEALAEGDSPAVRKLYAALAGIIPMSADDYGHC